MLLSIKDLVAGYDGVNALFSVNIHVNESEAVSLVGSNGAGKTTLLRVISGLVKPTSGTVEWMGRDITNMPAYSRVEEGIVQIPQGRGILVSLTVQENMILGTYNKRTRPFRKQLFDETIEIFPVLKQRLRQIAGTLSGGEQQMLAVARSLMLQPKLLIMDEPSLGLSPKLVEEVFSIISTIKRKGVSMLVIEQNLLQALKVTERGYVMETGRITMEDKSAALMNNNDVRRAYLGI